MKISRTCTCTDCLCTHHSVALIHSLVSQAMTVTDDNVIYGGEVVELAKEVVVDTEDMSGVVKARDKRSGLVDRTRKMRQVLCYICCAEFGTTSLKIHQKTCLKKHKW
jgi:hypothetical protein